MSDDVVDDVRRIFDDLDEVAERVQSARFAAPLRPMGVAARGRGRPRARPRPGGRRRGPAPRCAPAATVDEAERLGLRAIVQQEGRPAIVVRDGDFGDPPALWSHLNGRRERIREVIARAGRVEVDGHPDHAWVGTAWLVAPATLMTNRHVATKFCRRGRRRSWTFRPGMQSRIDFVREQDSADSLQFEITEAIGVHEDHDLALLRIEGASRDGRPLPDPLAVAASAPRDLLGREVYLVGYPMSDPDRNEPEAIAADLPGRLRRQAAAARAHGRVLDGAVGARARLLDAGRQLGLAARGPGDQPRHRPALRRHVRGGQLRGPALDARRRPPAEGRGHRLPVIRARARPLRASPCDRGGASSSSDSGSCQSSPRSSAFADHSPGCDTPMTRTASTTGKHVRRCRR